MVGYESDQDQPSGKDGEKLPWRPYGCWRTQSLMRDFEPVADAAHGRASHLFVIAFGGLLDEETPAQALVLHS